MYFVVKTYVYKLPWETRIFFVILRSAEYNVGQKVFMQSSLYLEAKY